VTPIVTQVQLTQFIPGTGTRVAGVPSPTVETSYQYAHSTPSALLNRERFYLDGISLLTPEMSGHLFSFIKRLAQDSTESQLDSLAVELQHALVAVYLLRSTSAPGRLTGRAK